MKSLGQLKKEREAKYSELFKECLVFFAFSDEQFAKNKTPLQEGEKYVAGGAGMYLPKGKVDAYVSGSKAINKWYKDTVKENKLRRANIEYALHNHEATYTGEIEDAMAELGEDYTESEVREVFKSMLATA
jgi:hypothetical protein